MNNIIKYLNDNAGAITSIATSILAIITSVYVYFTYKLSKEAKGKQTCYLRKENQP